MRLYLASTSPARLTTLRAAGIEPSVLPSNVDEKALVETVEHSCGPLSATEMVGLLARAKAEAVAGILIDGQPLDGFILGCDSAFELDGIIYGKPHRPEIARTRWLLQRGRSGVLYTGLWLIDHRCGTQAGGSGEVFSTEVTFASDISDEEIDAYIATGEPLTVAGAFTIDGLGAAFISGIDGDPHTVVGLSVAGLRQLLRTFDVTWPSLWNRVPGTTDL